MDWFSVVPYRGKRFIYLWSPMSTIPPVSHQPAHFSRCPKGKGYIPIRVDSRNFGETQPEETNSWSDWSLSWWFREGEWWGGLLTPSIRPLREAMKTSSKHSCCTLSAIKSFFDSGSSEQNFRTTAHLPIHANHYKGEDSREIAMEEDGGGSDKPTAEKKNPTHHQRIQLCRANRSKLTCFT